MAFKNLIPWKNKGGSELARRDDGDPFSSLHREMNRLFDEFNRGMDIEPFTQGAGAMWTPKINVVETDTEVTVTAELPGMDEKNIEVALTGDTLTLKGEKSEEKEEKDKNYHRMERVFGSFYREIPLPAEVETDKVDATFKKGVLMVKLPKTREAQKAAKKIPVKGS